MTMLLVAALGLAALLAGLALTTIVPRDARLGVTLALGVGLLFGATSRNVPETIRDGTLVVATVAVLIAALLSPRPLHSRRAPFGVLAAFFTVMVVTTLAMNPEAQNLVVRISVVSIAFAFAAGRLERRGLAVLLDGLSLLAVIEAVLGAIEFFVTGEPIPWGRRVAEDGSFFDDTNKLLGGSSLRVQGTTEHPIPYAVVLLVGALALGVRWAAHASLLRVAAVALIGLGLVLSGTRSAIVALALGGAYLVLSSEASTRVLRVTVVALGGLVGAAVFLPVIADAVSTLLSSGSYENRAGALESVPRLLGQDFAHVLLGNGAGSEPGLYANGLLPQTGFQNVDNQLVTSLATTGVLGAGLLIAAFLTGFASAARPGRVLILALATMLFSFDYLAWSSMAALMAVAICLPRHDGEPAPSRSTTKAAGLTSASKNRLESTRL
ncbi:hypothetical protein EDF46_1567 [Frondihabitans sp. PhB188]|uniref:O-antigen ligase family protein n=1 Tax=Frondihabitans sp. PhB188 TaxID=2485200 RepID=UPI000F4AC4B1|nr:O-antigen ligase family protein [Frondihabitans sp. PhB188]ROQ39932.1 hypothetical protein EDF46_1567 [Frondihabitans sp. PhB188]